MSDNSYCAYRDGKFVEVPKIEDLCLALKDKFMRQEELFEIPFGKMSAADRYG